ncbi:MAG TPA: RNA polymerase sigma factor, partial [Planctomycetaceae bacterium]|nr:RNA polymerase sigma factor [Planctomycetaceae bacterium]
MSSTSSESVSALDWGAALAQHESWLRRVVYARVGDAQDVDDVMQEVAVAALAQRSPLLDATKIAPWLYQLAVRQSLLFRRKCGRRRKLLERYREARAAKGSTSDAPPEPLAWLLHQERAELVQQALAALSARDREILLLKYTERWSYRDLAKHLGVTANTVESRLHRARCRLRTQLARLAGSSLSSSSPADTSG